MTNLQCFPCVFQYYHVLRCSLEAQQVGTMQRLPSLWLQPISRCVVACRGGWKGPLVSLPVLEMILSSFARRLPACDQHETPTQSVLVGWRWVLGSFACDFSSQSASVSVSRCKLIQWCPWFGFVLLRFSTFMSQFAAVNGNNNPRESGGLSQ